jgi:sphinganine-1-phosphate aldolase
MTMNRKAMPQSGLDWPALEAMMDEMANGDVAWQRGRAPAYVFGATEQAKDIARSAYFKFFTENALGAKRAFFGIRHMEEEVVEMALDLFHAPADACGNMTTGGTESILLAVKSCRDHWRATHGGAKTPLNIVAPLSLHPAFDKAAALMDLEIRRTVLRADFRADPVAMAAAIDDHTMMIVGSAPCFPHGVIDPIAELGALAVSRGIWLHVDACVGGYFAPFAKMLGYPIGDFDFVVPGVRSLSADLHKFGYAAKPASTVFYRGEDLHKHQKFDFDTWSSGRFTTETLVGTRPGGAVAAAWALMIGLGRAGYLDIADRALRMTRAYIDGIEAIPGLAVVGAPDLSIISYRATTGDIRAIAAEMSARGWLVNMTKTPPAIHIMMSLLHEPIRAEYLADLRDAVAAVKGGASDKPAVTAIY